MSAAAGSPVAGAERSPGRERSPGAARSPGTAELDVTVAVPLTERPEPLGPLYEEYAAPLRAAGERFEFLFVVPPWALPLAKSLDPLIRAGEPIRVIELGQSLHEASLLKLAAAQARGRVLVTLPAYYRVQADGLMPLIERVRSGAELTVARRWPRRDSMVNQLQTKLFHWFMTRLAGRGLQLHDVGCGVRAMRPGLLQEVPVYGDFSRFLPLLALQEGWRVEEVDVPQHERDAKTRVYGPGTYLRRLIDVIGVLFLVRFTYKPLRFFGLVGSIFAVMGGLILFVLFVQRLGGEPMGDRPLLLLGVLTFTFGVQAVALGLVGEMIVHLHAPQRRRYRVRSPGESDLRGQGVPGSETDEGEMEGRPPSRPGEQRGSAGRSEAADRPSEPSLIADER